ncbi:MAG TPA: nickel pincer cofactor biosynthesis protein LarB [Polyangiaceae bacterium]|nr:nickel pincer cofactor biosynthesis protein LarB [Polyangiaceae bacterium]
MDRSRLAQLLEAVSARQVDVPTALAQLSQLPFADLSYARVDHHRALRQGMAEVIFAPGKTAEQIAGVASRLIAAGQDVLVTRLEASVFVDVAAQVPSLTYRAAARTASFQHQPRELTNEDRVAIVTAGTSDVPVAEEAIETLRMAGIGCRRFFDVGVAGIHRLLSVMPELSRAEALVVIAGMEGALPSVVGGLVAAPVIAVPTSVGYGTALSGFTALLGMLTSCASGVTVVNIDNGFGAAMAVMRQLKSQERR